MYRVCKTDLVLLCSRGKAHEIISHAMAEDAVVEWSVIKEKLMSNYRSTISGIEASVKISKLSMSSSSQETVGEYLARSRTLVKSKKMTSQCGIQTSTKLMHTTYATDY